jgi:hypothetical protein
MAPSNDDEIDRFGIARITTLSKAARVADEPAFA